MRQSLSWPALLLVILAACNRYGPQPNPAVVADARHQLEARGREDQAVRIGFGAGGVLDTVQARAMMRTDSSNTNWLRAYVARWGWPTAKAVGPEAEQAAFLIVQHAVHDTAFMRAMLPMIEQAFRRGDLKGEAVAMLADRLAVKAGHPQKYGTQLSLRNGRWVLDPIADSVHVDERRKRMGLPPLAIYKQMFDSIFNPPRH